MFRIVFVTIVLASLTGAFQAPVDAQNSDPPSSALVDFESDIAPIIREHCLRCHRPGNALGDMQLATDELLREYEYIVAGDPDASYLVELISSVDGNPPEMPQDGEPLSDEQVQLFRRWIKDGGEWPDAFEIKHKPKGGPDWWAFQPLRQFEQVDTPSSDVIDRWIDQRLAADHLQRDPPADRATLVRRATYDLIGLPPTPAEVHAFVHDNSPDAYEQLIERLLASPHYGERWGRHWLDVVRFGESVGFEKNEIIENLWPFRDYVIRSINADKPFDQLIREHVAGDVLNPNDTDSIIGSAFLVAGPYDNVNNQDAVQKAQIRANTVDEIIRASSEAFLGLTIGCARCHDHKFDPITQQDYYSLYSTFSGIKHGSAPLATARQQSARLAKTGPLLREVKQLERQLTRIDTAIVERAESEIEKYNKHWTRPAVDRTGTVEKFPTVEAKFVRLVCESQDLRAVSPFGWRIDEFEIWSDQPQPVNVALASNGGKASGKARRIEDFPGAYGPQLTIDGKFGARFISEDKHLTIELAKPTAINKVVFSSARGEDHPEHQKFVFVAEYRIEVSQDGQSWTEVANGDDRKPSTVNFARMVHGQRKHRLLQLATTEQDRQQQRKIRSEIAAVKKQLASLKPFPTAWIGSRDDTISAGPFHVFLGGSPQKPGEEIVAKSLSVFDAANDAFDETFDYRTDDQSTEAERRMAFARWLTNPRNPLPPRVLANRLWHYHFGTGLVSTPSNFGFMGERPSHPELLDFLAGELINNHWRIKPMHRMIMLSKTYQQSSAYRKQAAAIDGDSRLLWRFPPRRMSAEEIRDTVLQISGAWNRNAILEPDQSNNLVPDGGPGFRLYHFMRDNVSTYKPLDRHGSETYRRAVYHQNARASVVDLMTDFDQPDCAFSTPRRSNTTTPLQALTMLNHSFTLDMADSLAQQLAAHSSDTDTQIRWVYQLGYTREPDKSEMKACRRFIEDHGLAAFCRVFLNTSELIYVK
tara:strand:+ start:120753 stop:123707 length:2955 start_codon:yes stop_codon:yes gene_type:complete